MKRKAFTGEGTREETIEEDEEEVKKRKSVKELIKEKNDD